jgi:hypothetical protein
VLVAAVGRDGEADAGALGDAGPVASRNVRLPRTAGPTTPPSKAPVTDRLQ